jgi:hypothetical protein
MMEIAFSSMSAFHNLAVLFFCNHAVPFEACMYHVFEVFFCICGLGWYQRCELQNGPSFSSKRQMFPRSLNRKKIVQWNNAPEGGTWGCVSQKGIELFFV